MRAPIVAGTCAVAVIAVPMLIGGLAAGEVLNQDAAAADADPMPSLTTRDPAYAAVIRAAARVTAVTPADLATIAATDQRYGRLVTLLAMSWVDSRFGTATAPAADRDAVAAASAAEQAGFVGTGLVTAVAIAGAESGWDAEAVAANRDAGGHVISTDRGLWQINSVAHPEYDSVRLVADPVYNAEAAYRISAGGTDWGPWCSWWSSGACQVGEPGRGPFLARVAVAQHAVEMSVRGSLPGNRTGLVSAPLSQWPLLAARHGTGAFDPNTDADAVFTVVEAELLGSPGSTESRLTAFYGIGRAPNDAAVATHVGEILRVVALGPGGADSAAALRGEIVQVADSQVGYRPDGNCATRYAATCESWCALFVTWVWSNAGVQVPLMAASGDIARWAATSGTWKPGAHALPEPGDAVLYGTSPDDSAHAGIVASVLPDGEITTIDGNFDGAVTLRGPFDPRTATNGEGAPVYGFAAPLGAG